MLANLPLLWMTAGRIGFYDLSYSMGDLSLMPVSSRVPGSGSVYFFTLLISPEMIYGCDPYLGM